MENREVVYSANGDDNWIEDLQDVLEELDEDTCTIFRGYKKAIPISKFIDINATTAIIDDLEEQLYDLVGDVSFDSLDFVDPHKLNKILVDAIVEMGNGNQNLNVYQVVEVEEIEVEKGDIVEN